MKVYLNSKREVASYVNDLLLTLDPNSALTMTIVVEKSEVYSVLSVIDASLDDTEMQEYLKELQSIYEKEQAG